MTTHLTTGPPDNGLWHRVRGLLRRCERVDVVVAFTMPSGVALLEPELRDALRRGVHVRLLTGDYLGITAPGALRRLLSLEDALSLLAEDGEADEMRRGVLELRVIESSAIREASFHPKAWLFEWAGGGVGFVGSSNLSRAALVTGIEWNLAVDRERDPETFAELGHAFNELWQRATHVTHPWVDVYTTHVARLNAHDPGRDVIEALVTGTPPKVPASGPIAPRPSQREALDALATHRAAGHTRGLLVMATGLGKTWVAAFDAAQCAEALGRRLRVLVIAHRVELLTQAGETFSQHDPEANVRFLGDGLDLEYADVVLASIQLLTRGHRLDAFDPHAFDYVVIDEVHHAAALTYRRVLAHLQPSFLLGLTATPVRGDGADIAALFGGMTVYEATLRQGIEQGALVPFRYKGLRDTIDYAPIPWRAGRFDPDALMEASQTQKRLARLWEAWEDSDATRTLVFCCSIAHARKMAQWLVEQGVRAVSVHSGTDSADRAESIAALGKGCLDAVCTVDLFNEGVDLPSVDRVVMLRPTDSRVIFLQQLGRGLRTSPDTGKTALEVVDFVGNHRAFLDRLRLILEISAGSLVALRAFLQDEDTAPDLPPGCEVDIELEARHVLLELMPDAATDSVVAAYQGWRETYGNRPRAAELQANGYNVRVLRTTYQSWFLFVLEQGDLNAEEHEALSQARDHFEALERVAWGIDELEWLTVLLEAGEMTLEQERTHSDRLTRELDCVRLKDGVLSCVPVVEPRLHGIWTEMMWEVVEYLSLWRGRIEQGKLERAGGFSARVIQASGRPILKLPARETASHIPEGMIDVRLPGLALWSFRFVKIACNVAHPVGEQTNRLGDLMREWFGAHAGAPGTTHQVFFWQTAGGWSLEPVRDQVNGLVAGCSYTPDDLVAMLGEDTLMLVKGRDRLTDHTTLQAQEGDDRLMAHVAFVRHEREVRYHGEAHRTSPEDPWRIMEVDFETWRTHGGSGASRALPERASAYAKAFVSACVGAEMHGQFVEALARRCRILGVTGSGSLRIDGGKDGFGERKISVTDLGWVLLARMNARHADAVEVNAQVVNALRYLEGTPKSSTRYIDTQWALVLTAALGWDVIVEER